MANPTTNYSFVLPTSADLVTDLPADFDIALQGVDTRLKALQPGTTAGDLAYSSATANTNVRLGIGTTGQVLAVVAGVPAWATTADQTPLTTKGDLFTFTTVDARLAVGTNGQVLTCDSAEATGLKYATPASSGFVGCSLFNTVGINTSNNTTTTFTFDSEDYDTDAFHSTSVNNSRITIPAGKAGKYLVTGVFMFDVNTTGDRLGQIFKNGTFFRQVVGMGTTNSAGYADFGLCFSFQIELAVADFIELKGKQNSGGTLAMQGSATSTTLQVQFLGA